MASKITIAILGILLIISNGYWLNAVVDSAVTQKYDDQMLYELTSENKQATGMLSDLLIGESKSEVITIASKHSELDPFDKNGCTYIGQFGFQFDEKDQLVAINPGLIVDGAAACN